MSAGLEALTRDKTLDGYAGLHSLSRFDEDLNNPPAIKYLFCNMWTSTYSAGSPKLVADTAREQVDYCMSEPELSDRILRDDATASGVAVAIIGDTVYFAQVFDILNTLDGDGDPAKLYDNVRANDPSWSELRLFLLNDDTDQHAYKEGSFVCVDYAVMLHNRAEAAGIRAAYVNVEFRESGPGHALNAFQTIDRGLVYIDCTGQGLLDVRQDDHSDASDLSSYDKVGYISELREYGLIHPEYADSFEYGFYEDWLNRWQQYDDMQDDYNAAMSALNRQIAAYNEQLRGRKVIKDPDEFKQLETWANELDDIEAELKQQRAVIDEMLAELGEFRWVSPGTVSVFYVHW